MECVLRIFDRVIQIVWTICRRSFLATIFSNLLVPLIEKMTLPKPFGKGGRAIMNKIVKNAAILTAITLVSGMLLGLV